MPGNTNNSNEDTSTLCPADSTDNGRGGHGDGGGGGDLYAAKSTCAGCGAALDRLHVQGSRECPNCKKGESVEGRHFFCSKACFASNWNIHSKLHVRVRHTITMDLRDEMQKYDTRDGRAELQPNRAANRVVDFGLLTDREWVDFQLTPEFTATMKQKFRASLESRHRIMMDIKERGQQEIRLMNVSLHAHLDVVCSMRQVGVNELHNAVTGIMLWKTVSSYREYESMRRPPNLMFEIIRRNFIYHVFLTARDPLKHLILVRGETTEDAVRNLNLKLVQAPTSILSECFESSMKDSFDEAVELTCPLYVCAFVATLLF